ncbi:MAG TPA: hypothetical protein VFW62_04980, partial [bacterium]|nr:hypothetical protein [bacterium]
EDSPKEETPVEKPVEKPAEEKHAEEKHAEERPAEEKHAEEKHAEEKPAEEKHAEEKPAEEKPAETPLEIPAADGDLAASIAAASTATKTFYSLDADDKDARKAAAAALYSAYSGLGHTVEQANLEDAANAEKLPSLHTLLTEAADEPAKLNTIGAMAAKKLDAQEGDPGIVLAGIVKDFRSAGSHFETTLELVRDKRQVTVVSLRNPQDRYKVEDQVLILGAVIRDPKEKLAGYKGEASLVVKSGHAMVLPPAEKQEPAEEKKE